MAVAAVFGYRRMDILLVKAFLAILVAFKAQLPFDGGGHQEFFVRAGMRSMASDTVACTHWAMAVFFCKNGLFVAVEAEAAH